MKRYEWAAGAPFKGDADKVQAEIERIKRSSGGATPEALVVCARSKRSVLHPLIFNVDESEAAERYYRARATSLLNAIRVVTTEGKVSDLRANVRVVIEGEPVYLGLEDPSARNARETWLRNRLVSIKQELRELGLYPSVALVIEEALAA